jgi:integrase/recombinase XerD
MAETLRSAIDTFLLDAQTRGLRAQSTLTYRRQLGYFAAFAKELQVTDLDQVTTALLRSYIVNLQTRGLRPASIRTAGRILRAWLNFCKAEGLLTEDADPMRRVRLPKQPRPDPDAFTAAEVHRLIEATARSYDSLRDIAIVLCLLDTGCRINEFTMLTRGDVDMDTGAVTIRAENAKTHARRIVYIGQRSRAALGDYMATLPPLAPDDPLWHGMQGPLTTDGMKNFVQRLGERAGVKPCGPHRYRRTFATWLLRDGTSPKDAAALLGHSIDELLRFLCSQQRRRASRRPRPSMDRWTSY